MEKDNIKLKTAPSTGGCIGCLGKKTNEACIKYTKLAVCQKLKPCVDNKIIYVEDKK